MSNSDKEFEEWYSQIKSLKGGVVRQAWNELYPYKERCETLEALLIEACKEIYWSTRYDEDSGILSIEDCEPERQRYDGHKLFLNKPEIKKLLEGVKGE